MFCTACGFQNSDAARFCQSCGRELAVAGGTIQPGQSEVSKQPAKKTGFLKRLLLVIGGLVFVGIIANLFSGSGPSSTGQQSSTSVGPPSVPPPNFRIAREDFGSPVVAIVAPSTTDDQMKSLLWSFRREVRERRFTELGLKKPTSVRLPGGDYDFNSGMIDVFRDSRYANKPSLSPDSKNHVDGLYVWGLDGDPNKDYAVIKGPNGSAVQVFDSSDNWQIPDADRQRLAAEKKASERCTVDDPMVTMPARMVLSGWESGSSTAQYWAGAMEKKHLFTVKDFDLLDRYFVSDKTSLTGRRPNSSALKFRIQSTTQGGFPITKDWYVDVELSDGDCKVYDVEEAD